MGWTSIRYAKAEHTKFTAEQALQFLKNEYYQFQFAAFHFVQAKDKYDHNECYVIMKNNTGGKAFICVFIIDIKDEEIYWKSISEEMGPGYSNCPTKFFEFVSCPTDETYAFEWRKECAKKRIKFKPITEYEI